MYADRPAIQVYARYYQGIAMAAAGDHDAGDQLARTSVSEAMVMSPSPDLMGQPLADALARAAAV
ncbi:MAG: hypothetical protein JSS45_00975 [Proteobacteria bacterium]|nr:hypothetical protein [Pseudomonadota bacterium]